MATTLDITYNEVVGAEKEILITKFKFYVEERLAESDYVSLKLMSEKLQVIKDEYKRRTEVSNSTITEEEWDAFVLKMKEVADGIWLNVEIPADYPTNFDGQISGDSLPEESET